MLYSRWIRTRWPNQPTSGTLAIFWLRSVLTSAQMLQWVLAACFKLWTSSGFWLSATLENHKTGCLMSVCLSWAMLWLPGYTCIGLWSYLQHYGTCWCRHSQQSAAMAVLNGKHSSRYLCGRSSLAILDAHWLVGIVTLLAWVGVKIITSACPIMHAPEIMRDDYAYSSLSLRMMLYTPDWDYERWLCILLTEIMRHAWLCTILRLWEMPDYVHSWLRIEIIKNVEHMVSKVKVHATESPGLDI